MQRIVFTALLFATTLGAQASSPHVRVDAFGYRPASTKIAVLREAVTGFDAPDPFLPSDTVQLRRASDDSVAFTGTPTAWNGGLVHGQSGDRVWWFDFSSFEEPGTYYVIDPGTGDRSEDFEVADDVYQSVLRDAVRVFFYQRSGFAKVVPFADSAWTDAASHLGSQQDLDCRLATNPTVASSRDLSGGWFDAGDYNKYVNFADGVVHDLLYAYTATPDLWTDDYGIPESGNGLPDLLDELKWELDWFLRMAEPNGSVLHKVSVTDFSGDSPPSTDSAPRRYAPATASATISASGAFAHAARVYATIPAWSGYANQLTAAAIAAWNWVSANPTSFPSTYDNAGFVNVSAEDDAYSQEMNRLAAAVHLFALTGSAVYRNYVDANYQDAHLFQWFWASQWEQEVLDALLDYARTPGATPAVAAHILDFFKDRVAGPNHLGALASEPDAYRAWLEDGNTTWGSNSVKSSRGILYLYPNTFGLDVANAERHLELAEGYLHYVHGVNPLGWTYLTNMASAPKSVTTMYHAWFADGTIWDSTETSTFGPPPGYLVGGANPTFAPNAAYTGPALVPPMGQPAQKSYRDWNAGWPEESWEVTEPSITYQSAYVRLVSAFALRRTPTLGLDVPDLVAGTPVTFELGGAEPGSLVAILWAFQPGTFVACLPTWCLELGLQLAPNPLANLLFLGLADGAGQFASSAVAPPTTVGLDLHFQATQAGADLRPIVSSVLASRVR